jgi:3-oxoacyl-[acyl-carrier-protein] synthase-3
MPAFDILAGCSGFLYGLDLASTMITSGNYKYILVCGAEIMSKIVDWTDRNTCVLFGDGASCCIITKSDGVSSILSSYLGADGNLGELLIQPAGGTRIPASRESVEKRLHYVHMQGREVFKHAVRRMGESCVEALTRASIKIENVDIFIPHQANYRICEATCQRVKMPLEKMHLIIHKYGNVPAASIPLTLNDALNAGKIKKGTLILLAAFGAGFTWGGMVIRW